MKTYFPESLKELHPGPWRPDPETFYWATECGLIAIPAWEGDHISWNRWTNERVVTTQRRKAKFPRMRQNAKGYLRLNSELAHRVVARAWIPNLENKPQVHHIDHVKHNNHASNLKWVTNAENVQDAYDFGLIPPRKRNNKGQFS